MDKPDLKLEKLLLSFAVICLLTLSLVLYSAFTQEAEAAENFDKKSGEAFKSHRQMSDAYLGATSTQRTLDEYYSRRQYAGSPPYIPHDVEKQGEAEINCLPCHGKGGWAEPMKRYTPVTPHPELVSCRQCHVKLTTDTVFVKNNWKSTPPPRLGESDLPGSPPAIPHDLQMRGDCVACHVGPGAVNTIRVDHPDRGYCRQCHAAKSNAALFKRKAGNP